MSDDELLNGPTSIDANRTVAYDDLLAAVRLVGLLATMTQEGNELDAATSVRRVLQAMGAAEGRPGFELPPSVDMWDPSSDADRRSVTQDALQELISRLRAAMRNGTEH